MYIRIQQSCDRVRPCSVFTLTFANPRGRGCFHGRGFLSAFPIPRMNKWLHWDTRSGLEEPFFVLWPFAAPDVAVTMRRLIENDVPRMRRNEGESTNARGMPKSLLKGRGTPNKKGVSFGETAYRANWVWRNSLPFFPFLVSPPPLVWYLINYENWTYTLCRTFSAIRGKLPSLR